MSGHWTVAARPDLRVFMSGHPRVEPEDDALTNRGAEGAIA